MARHMCTLFLASHVTLLASMATGRLRALPLSFMSQVLVPIQNKQARPSQVILDAGFGCRLGTYAVRARSEH